MIVVPLTLTIVFCLGFTVAVFFLREQLAGRAAKPTRVAVDAAPADRPGAGR